MDSQKQKFMEKLDQEKTERLGHLHVSFVFLLTTRRVPRLDQLRYERDMARYQEDLEWVRSLTPGRNFRDQPFRLEACSYPRNDYSLAMKCAHRIYSLRDWFPLVGRKPFSALYFILDRRRTWTGQRRGSKASWTGSGCLAGIQDLESLPGAKELRECSLRSASLEEWKSLTTRQWR